MSTAALHKAPMSSAPVACNPCQTDARDRGASRSLPSNVECARRPSVTCTGAARGLGARAAWCTSVRSTLPASAWMECWTATTMSLKSYRTTSAPEGYPGGMYSSRACRPWSRDLSICLITASLPALCCATAVASEPSKSWPTGSGRTSHRLSCQLPWHLVLTATGVVTAARRSRRITQWNSITYVSRLVSRAEGWIDSRAWTSLHGNEMSPTEHLLSGTVVSLCVLYVAFDVYVRLQVNASPGIGPLQRNYNQSWVSITCCFLMRYMVVKNTAMHSA